MGITQMKYASDLCTLSNCPPIGCKSIKKEAFRFVFNPICEKSFTPQGKKNPQRVSKSTNNSERCSLLGLSMFESEDCAIKRYKYLKKMVKNINKTLGSHLAKGTIQPQYGLITHPNNYGHYDLFEFKDVDLSTDFKITLDLSGV